MNSIAVECPECGRTVGIVASPENVWVALQRHHCHPSTRTRQPQPEGTDMPLPAEADKRPHPRELLNHPDKRIARAAQRVMDAVARLDEAWEANSEKAALRAKRDKLRKQLAAVEAELKGAPAAPKRDLKPIRAWARANGHQVPDVGKIPQHILDLYDQENTA